jgi:poly(ADP-ribose) glycohydrolase ARH3
MAVLYAVSLGGDTDTIASMAGALSGAYLGESAIPLRWREEAEGAHRLREMADGLFDLATESRAEEETQL